MQLESFTIIDFQWNVWNGFRLEFIGIEFTAFNRNFDGAFIGIHIDSKSLVFDVAFFEIEIRLPIF